MTISEEYVHLKVSIPKSLSTRFRELVSLKHPYFQKDSLSYEIEQAMRQYIASYTSTHTDTQSEIKAEKANPNPKIYTLKQDIIKWLTNSQLYLEIPQFLPTTHLVKAISASKGTDERTVKKYLKLLEDFGCIKQSGPYQYEFV